MDQRGIEEHHGRCLSILHKLPGCALFSHNRAISPFRPDPIAYQLSAIPLLLMLASRIPNDEHEESTDGDEVGWGEVERGGEEGDLRAVWDPNKGDSFGSNG